MKIKLVLFFLFLVVNSLSIGQAFTKTYETTGNKEVGNALGVTQDRDFIIVGRTNGDFEFSNDLLVLKVTQMGDTLWTTYIDMDSSGIFATFHENGTGVVLNEEDEIFVCASAYGTFPDYLATVLIKLDQDGNVLASRMTDAFSAEDMILSSSGRLMLCGTGYFSFAGPRAQLAQFDQDLNMLWTIQFASPSGDDAGLRGICEISSNAYAIGGYGSNFLGEAEAMMGIVDSVGNLVWWHDLQMGIAQESVINGVVKYNDTTFVCVGRTYVPSSFSTAAAWMMNINGSLHWNVGNIGAGAITDFHDVIVNQNSNLVCIGVYDSSSTWNDSKGMFFEYDGNGNTIKGRLISDINQMKFNGIQEEGNAYFICGSVGPTGSEDVVFIRNKFIDGDTLCGIEDFNSGFLDPTFIAYGTPTVPTAIGISDGPYPFEQFKGMSTNTRCEHDSDLGNDDAEVGYIVYPNPSRNLLFVANYFGDYELFDLNGRMLLEGQLNTGEPIDISELSEGMYLLKLRSQMQRIVKL